MVDVVEVSYMLIVLTVEFQSTHDRRDSNVSVQLRW